MVFIRADGTEREVEGYLTLEGLQYVVGGHVEHVRLPDGRHMFRDEDKTKHKPVNYKATSLYEHGEYVVGDVLIMTEDEYVRMSSNVRWFRKR